MAVIELPDAVRREIADLPRFEIQPSAVLDEVVLTAKVWGVPVAMYLSAATYPAESPRIELLRGWSWSRRENIDRRRRIRGLECQLRWNRTLGIGAPLRELEVLFREQPPRRKQVAKRREGRSLLQTLADAFERALGWLRGLLRRSPAADAKSSSAAKRSATSPESVRARYQEVIREKSARVALKMPSCCSMSWISSWNRPTSPTVVKPATIGRR